MSSKSINLTLKVWRQPGPAGQGRLETYQAENIPTDASFLEMLDIVNERLTLGGQEPIAFDHDCREGICGMCGSVVNGRPHGPERETTLCQLHMRHFHDGDTVMRKRVHYLRQWPEIWTHTQVDHVSQRDLEFTRPQKTISAIENEHEAPPSWLIGRKESFYLLNGC